MMAAVGGVLAAWRRHHPRAGGHVRIPDHGIGCGDAARPRAGRVRDLPQPIGRDQRRARQHLDTAGARHPRIRVQLLRRSQRGQSPQLRHRRRPVGNEAALATGIAGLPQRVRYCVHITHGDATDTSVWDVPLRQQWPDGTTIEKIAYVIRTLEVADDRYRITSITYK